MAEDTKGPSTSMDKPFGRNKEITDGFSIDAQARAAIERSRTSTSQGKIRESIGNEGGKVTTAPGLSV